MQVETIYSERIHSYDKAMRAKQQLLKTLGMVRLLTFLLTSFFVYKLIFTQFNTIWLWPIAAGVVLFGVLLVRYVRVKEQYVLLEKLLWINKTELQSATELQWNFADGKAYINEQHDFSGDLDVFGEASLFNYINRTGTLQGELALAKALQHPHQDIHTIEDIQKAVQTLAPSIELRQHFLAEAMLAQEKKDDVEMLKKWIDMPMEFINNNFWRWFSYINPALLIASFFYGNNGITLFFFALNWIALLLNVSKVNKQHSLVSNKERMLGKFAVLLKKMEEVPNAADSKVLSHQAALAKEAGASLQQLSRINNSLDQRLNILVAVVLNSIILYDFHCMYRLEKWKQQNSQRIMDWFAAIAQMEVLNTFSTFAYNHPHYVYPTLTNEANLIEGKDVGHPLIPVDACVANDMQIGVDGQFHIITGSNMSGKSTFLRSVGVNFLLAMQGAPVCAREFKCSPARIMTSMRIKDSIARHTSYFQAELLRLQHIIKVLQSGVASFIILDEILKGTNSEDKLTGSRELIAHFLRYNCMGMIATHDLELGHMEETYPSQIRNYCFESTIENDHLHFDYRMRRGVARNKNATFLMRQMAII